MELVRPDTEPKKLIKVEKAPQLDNINADELTCWCISIPDDDDDHFPIPLNSAWKEETQGKHQAL